MAAAVEEVIGTGPGDAVITMAKRDSGFARRQWALWNEQRKTCRLGEHVGCGCGELNRVLRELETIIAGHDREGR